jgi:polyhydroxybutyrate depolymerase
VIRAARLLALLPLLLLAIARPAPAQIPAQIQAQPCDPCAIEGGVYHALAPPGWDGQAKLKLLMFLHGWKATGTDMLHDPSVAGPAAQAGFLLVAPDGLDKSWGHVGSPNRERDDLAFLAAVVDDALRRWPVDPGQVVVGGFSQGGSMVWDLACYSPDRFLAFLPFSGGFWEKMPADCHGGPVNLRHVHGSDDTVVPMAGRHLFGRYAQADIRRGFAVWQREDGCPAAPEGFASEDELDCDIWPNCGSGKVLQLCLHPGDHEMRAAWLASGLRWALALPRSNLAR